MGGVFNTGGRLPASATLNGISGSFNGDSAYFDFNGDVGVHSGSSTVPLVVTFTDGSSMTVSCRCHPRQSRAWEYIIGLPKRDNQRGENAPWLPARSTNPTSQHSLADLHLIR